MNPRRPVTSKRLSLLILASAFAALTAAASGHVAPTASAAVGSRAEQVGDCSAVTSTRTLSGSDSAADPNYVRITFMNQCGEMVPLYVDLAADDLREQQGLMGISSMPEDQGELFVFNNLGGGAEVHVSFWMKDTLIPLSVAFIGKDGTINEIQDMEAESLDTHTPQLPYLYAVEANLDWFADNGIMAGDQANLMPALALLGGSTSP